VVFFGSGERALRRAVGKTGRLEYGNALARTLAALELRNLAERLAFRKRLLDYNAFFWLAARARLKPAFVWGVLGAYLWLGWGFQRSIGTGLMKALTAATGIVLSMLLKGWFASEAGRQLAEDRLHGTMELLLSRL